MYQFDQSNNYFETEIILFKNGCHVDGRFSLVFWIQLVWSVDFNQWLHVTLLNGTGSNKFDNRWPFSIQAIDWATKFL